MFNAEFGTICNFFIGQESIIAYRDSIFHFSASSVVKSACFVRMFNEIQWISDLLVSVKQSDAKYKGCWNPFWLKWVAANDKLANYERTICSKITERLQFHKDVFRRKLFKKEIYFLMSVSILSYWFSVQGFPYRVLLAWQWALGRSCLSALKSDISS